MQSVTSDDVEIAQRCTARRAIVLTSYIALRRRVLAECRIIHHCRRFAVSVPLGTKRSTSERCRLDQIQSEDIATRLSGRHSEMLPTSSAFRTEWLGARHPPSACPTKRAVLLFQSSVSSDMLTGNTVTNWWRTDTLTTFDMKERFKTGRKLAMSAVSRPVFFRNGVMIACFWASW